MCCLIGQRGKELVACGSGLTANLLAFAQRHPDGKCYVHLNPGPSPIWVKHALAETDYMLPQSFLAGEVTVDIGSLFGPGMLTYLSACPFRRVPHCL
jgi:hypothetical protein